MSTISDFDRMVMEFMQDDPMTATYIQQGEMVFNPSTGVNSSLEIRTTVSGILLDLTMQSNGLTSKFGTAIVAGDKEFLMLPPEKADPLATALIINTVSDRVIVAGISYTVIAMREANPTGAAPVLFDLHIRR